jgi:hypothetical protein
MGAMQHQVGQDAVKIMEHQGKKDISDVTFFADCATA